MVFFIMKECWMCLQGRTNKRTRKLDRFHRSDGIKHFKCPFCDCWFLKIGGRNTHFAKGHGLPKEKYLKIKGFYNG